MDRRTLWPESQRFYDTGLPTDFENTFRTLLTQLELPPHLASLLTDYYWPLAGWIAHARASSTEPVVIGVCGGQGSGKSTLCRLLTLILDKGFALRTATLSIDDIYHTRVTRLKLAETVHPLFATRGVPGTHDVVLGLNTLTQLKTLKSGETLTIPRFDKADDTRAPRSKWTCQTGPVDIILFEGWCVGAVPEDSAALARPVNSLERVEDADGVWRHSVNEALAGDYQDLFRQLDHLVLLAVADFDDVVRFRRAQEHQLSQSLIPGGAERGHHLMNDEDIVRFVMHYERLTRHILSEMPARADIVVRLDHQQTVDTVAVNKPL